jgi:hypothetical protein
VRKPTPASPTATWVRAPLMNWLLSTSQFAQTTLPIGACAHPAAWHAVVTGENAPGLCLVHTAARFFPISAWEYMRMNAPPGACGAHVLANETLVRVGIVLKARWRKVEIRRVVTYSRG